MNEALHLSEKERGMFIVCLNEIQQELEHSIDRISKRLIATHIQLLLDYCLRFYERQFITREPINRDLLARFESLLDTYLSSGKALRDGLPTVKYCASELCLSPGYFGDLIKKQTGSSAQTYIQKKIMDAAKEHLQNREKSISQISDELGFQYPQHFTRLFKKVVGCTPSEYRIKG